MRNFIRLFLALILTVSFCAGMAVTASARGRAGSAETSRTESAEPSQAETDSEESEPDNSRIPYLIVALGAGVIAIIAAVVQKRKQNAAGRSRGTPAVQNPPAGGQSVPDAFRPEGTTQPFAAPPIQHPANPGNEAQSLPLFLYCDGGSLSGRSYPVTEKVMTIGRDPGCDIRYPADTKGVSRRHCQVCRKGGSLILTDTGSTSGTFLRGKGRLAVNVPTAIREGDIFYLGEKRNAFRIITK